MKLLYHQGQAKNWWLNQKPPKIPLGMAQFGEERKAAWMFYPKVNDVMISDTWLVCGGTGSGKSVNAKAYLCFISIERPIIAFDWVGADSYLMHEPNSFPVNLPNNTKPFGVKGRYLYFPLPGARQKMPYEETVRPNLSKYNQVQLTALGFSPGAALYLRNILKRYGPFKDLETLYQFIEYFPINDNTSKFILKKIERGNVVLKHNKVYAPNDVINAQSKESLKKIFPSIMQKNIFCLDNKEEFDFKGAFLRGENIVFSFNDKDVGRVEINYYMSVIQTIRRQEPNSPHYVIFLEEAHKVLAREEKGIDEIIEDFVLVCRKISVGLMLAMPEVINLSDRVLNDMKNIITGKFKGENATKLIRTMGYADDAKIIPYLKFNRFTGEREFLYYNQDFGKIIKFNPFNSPCEIHREK